MSSVASSPELGLWEFQEFVATTRNRSLGNDWELEYSKFIQDEEIEFMTQHGNGFSLLLPKTFNLDYKNAPLQLKFGMADELGDLLWFNADSTDRVNRTIGDLCLNALQSRVDIDLIKPDTFVDLGKLACTFGEKLTVPNKLGLMFPDEPAGYVSVIEHPGYVLTRSSHRFRRSLDRGINEMSPPVASELEEIQSLDDSLGFNMLVLANIAQSRLGIRIGDIAKFTIAKLENRELNGKENDIHFDETFISAL